MNPYYDQSLEDRKFLDGLPGMPKSFREFGRPVEIDIDWHETENQGPIGSCQGFTLASILERLAKVRGITIQLADIFAYLLTQKIDGLLGRDVGSTISGGGKVAVTYGIPPEKLTGYPSSYPSRAEISRILSRENYAAAEKYKATSIWRVPKDNVDESLNFIGGGGGISIGITWYEGIIPRDRVVREFNPRGKKVYGGHAQPILGYDRNGNFRATNSHGDGPYIWTPEAWLQMMQHPNTATVGLVGTADSQPVDWYKDSPYFD